MQSMSLKIPHSGPGKGMLRHVANFLDICLQTIFSCGTFSNQAMALYLYIGLIEQSNLHDIS